MPATAQKAGRRRNRESTTHMTYTEKHLDQIDANLSRPGRNGDAPRLSQEITGDDQLKAAAKDVEMLWQATRLERLQGKLEMLKEYEREAKAEEKGNKNAKVVSMGKVRLIMSVAAGVLLMVAVGWYLFKPEPPATIQHQYLAAHFEEYILYDVMMGEAPAKATREQELAYNLFAIQDFDKAIPLLKKEWEEYGDQLSLFYLWVSYIAIGDHQNGIKYQPDVLRISESNPQMRTRVQSLIN